MSVLQRAANKVVLNNSNVASVVPSIGTGSGGQTANNGRMYITLKPWSERSVNATQVIEQINQKMQGVSGIKLLMQPGQDVSVGARLSRTLYRCTLQDADQDELNKWR
jgi:multidrug efflux pump subunit AcrB